MLERGFLLLFAFLAAVHSSRAQGDTGASASDDVGLNIDVSAQTKLIRHLTLDIDGELRLKDNISSFDRFALGPTIDYKITPWLKGSAGVIFMLVNNNSKERDSSDGSIKWIRNAKTTPRYRAFVALTGSYSIARFKISLRERYQYTFRSPYNATRDYYTMEGDYNYSEDVRRGGKSFHVLRSRLQVAYDIHHCPLTPYASAEIYNSLNDNFRTKKLRYTVGLDWKVNKQNALSLAWTYQDVRGEDGDDDVNSHLIGVGYAYHF